MGRAGISEKGKVFEIFQDVEKKITYTDFRNAI